MPGELSAKAVPSSLPQESSSALTKASYQPPRLTPYQPPRLVELGTGSTSGKAKIFSGEGGPNPTDSFTFASGPS